MVHLAHISFRNVYKRLHISNKTLENMIVKGEGLWP